MKDFFNHSFDELQSFCKEIGVAPTHAKTLMKYAYKYLSSTSWNYIGAHTQSIDDLICENHLTLPQKLKLEMERSFKLEMLQIDRDDISHYDKSVKFTFKLSDGNKINSILMPETSRLTLCISSQVGCRYGCSFCSSAKMGFIRDLSAGEILAQIVTANDWIKNHPNWPHLFSQSSHNKNFTHKHITNIVFMGMGEPLDNLDAIIKALDIMTCQFGLNLSLRHISVSTVGHLDGLKRLLLEKPDVRIALSVNAAHDKKRSELMPINKKYPIESLVEQIAVRTSQQKHSILIQYLLIDGINDSEQDAEMLLQLVKNLKVKVNLIPFNPPFVEQLTTDFKSPKPETVQKFKDHLYRGGIRVMTRYSKGQDIGAACGHLAIF